MSFILIRGGSLDDEVIVRYRETEGTAFFSSDYGIREDTVTLAPDVVAYRLAIPILDDALVEPDGTFTAELVDADGAALARATAIGTIRNDDRTVPGLDGAATLAAAG